MHGRGERGRGGGRSNPYTQTVSVTNKYYYYEGTKTVYRNITINCKNYNNKTKPTVNVQYKRTEWDRESKTTI